MTTDELAFYIERASKAAAAVGEPQTTFEIYSELLAGKISDEVEREQALSRLGEALGVKNDE